MNIFISTPETLKKSVLNQGGEVFRTNCTVHKEGTLALPETTKLVTITNGAFEYLLLKADTYLASFLLKYYLCDCLNHWCLNKAVVNSKIRASREGVSARTVSFDMFYYTHDVYA